MNYVFLALAIILTVEIGLFLKVCSQTISRLTRYYELWKAKSEAREKGDAQQRALGDLSFNTFMGLGDTQVQGGQIVAVMVHPKTVFAPVHPLFASQSGQLLILDVSIDGRNIFVSSDGCPVEIFCKQQIDWPTVSPSQGIEFHVKNPAPHPIKFMGAFFGKSLKKW